ncbi:short-chain dehydrogenase [Sutcliffiella horikoshii]|uniref:Short-chain dehydrogenase n=1 Tax=Sutcliffiella horikoshii TaxID=79883 RepID=A0A5D4SV98_9BACI|nr:short-chain dehydrogenase [Sutcliffiella horikoshii]TYS65776.1 short-chain dehydrogenase [Sutcliffiella horikoshii]
MPFHEFGIIHDFNIRKDYSYYSPEEYSCISVDDDLIQNFSESKRKMVSYFHLYERLGFGLAYYGVSIIPPESLSLFYEVIVSFPSLKE